MSLTVRPACDDDVDAMHRIRLAVRENRLADPALVQPHHYPSMLRGHGRGWVARVEGRIVGFAIADLAQNQVWALFVDPDFEGRGIGRRLHDVMLDWFFASGAQRVRLATDPGTRAEAFYRAAGWLPAGEHRGEVCYEMPREQWLARRGEGATG